jgi:hypothetical protein
MLLLVKTSNSRPYSGTSTSYSSMVVVGYGLWAVGCGEKSTRSPGRVFLAGGRPCQRCGFRYESTSIVHTRTVWESHALPMLCHAVPCRAMPSPLSTSRCAGYRCLPYSVHCSGLYPWSRTGTGTGTGTRPQKNRREPMCECFACLLRSWLIQGDNSSNPG